TKKDKEKQGIVDYVSNYLEKKEIPDIKDYLVDAYIEITNPLINQDKKKSRLSLIKAGNINKHYSEKLSKIDWKDLYKNNFGYFLFENLKKELKEKHNFDYIFIDSRTGFNDISGICTVQLPDTIVLLFGLNSQNIEGIESIYKSIKDKNLIPVITPLNDISINDLDSKMEPLSKIFPKIPNAISYSSLFSGKENIIFQNKYKNMISVTEQYILIANEIFDRNKKDTNYLRDHLIQNINDISKTQDLIDSSNKILELKPLSIDFFHHALLLYRKQDLIEAKKYIQKAIEINNKSSNYLYLELLILSSLDEEINEKIAYITKLFPNDIGLSKLITEIYSNKFKFEEAKKFAKKDNLLLSNIYLKEEKYVDALNYVNKNVLSSKDFFTLSDIYSRVRDFDKSLQSIESALEREKDNLDFISFKAYLLKNISKYDEALEIYLECEKKQPNNSKFSYNLSSFYYDISEEEKAIPYIEKALKISPNDIENNFMSVFINFNLEKIESLENTLEVLEYLVITKNKKTIFIPRLIELLININQEKKANFYYELLKSLDVSKSDNKIFNEYNSINIKRSLAISAILLKKYNDVIEIYSQKNIIKKDVNEEYYFNLAISYLKIGNLEIAIYNFKKSVITLEKMLNTSSYQAKCDYLLCISIALSYIGEKEKSLLNLSNCISFIEKNVQIKYIFSPKDYRLIKRNDFLDLCNDIKIKIENNEYPF
ncbi:MAG: hypothetical protein AABZ74_11860, partial [Cyanobacteriota bacterium]